MQSALTHTLLCQWQTTLQTFDVDKSTAEEAFFQLVAVYSSPHRYYHTLQHINHVLCIIDVLQIYTQNLAVVQLAAWFHDVVYDTLAQDNEEKSANYACELLSNLNLPRNAIATVTSLILNTQHHQAAEDDHDSQVLLDADLAILAANSVKYQEYADAIRQEFEWISDANYIQGRKQVLKKILQRQRIYFTPLMFEFAEPSARDNLVREIQSLLYK